MPEYRTPEERIEQDAQRIRIRKVLDQALRDTTSLIVAMDLKEPEDVVELWVNRLWNGLRDGLSDNHPQAPGSRLRPDEDRLAAIVLLLQEKAEAIADAIERGLADA